MAKNTKKTKTKQDRSFIGGLVKWLFVFGLWCAILLVGILAWYGRELPELMRNAQFVRKPAITVLANDGSVVARYGDHKGRNLSVKDLPEDLVHAVLATEDRRFYYHFGLDPIGIMRAIVVNATHKGVVQGASTITQQLAKNLFLTKDRTLSRKIQEAMLAIWLEVKLSKDEILSAYLNRVYLGGGAYGVDAASRVYFDKDPEDLNLRECAILAGLLKAPSRYSPISNPKASNERANVVLNNMVDAGYLKESDVKKRGTSLPVPEKKPTPKNAARYYSDWIVEQLDDLINVVEAGDVIVETTMDPDVEKAVAMEITRTVTESGAKNKFSEGASMVLRPDGSVIALVGGASYSQSQFNRATKAMRSPGSSFKPIVYLTALRAGYGLDSVVIDEPISYNGYRPENFGNKYYGPVTLYEALTLSLNTVAVQLAYNVGGQNIIDTARMMGITSDLVPNLSTALGSNGVTMVEMASVYASIRSNGLAIEPFGIKRVKKKDGTVLYKRAEAKPPQVIPGYPVTQLKEMMHSVVVQGTGAAANPGVWAAGKTGTSQEHRDAWFDGFTNDYIALVWYGNDNNSPTARVTGGSFPARSWKAIVQAAMADPTPAPYEEMMGSSNSFGNLLTRIFSFGENSDGENGVIPLNAGNRNDVQSAHPDNADGYGENVGYGRFND
ncbi:MAG: transglycosylase domain-containing protein [Pseudobdellovibrionaceae bacterium]